MISKVLVKSPDHRQQTTSAPPLAPPRRARRSGRRLLTLAILAAAAAAAYFTVPWQTVAGLLPLGGAKPTAAPTVRAVPVVAVAARQGDMSLYLNGLGSVTALYTVTLRSRVDGELIKVAFSEGQIVQKGDLLAQIDPRLYLVQRQQAQGQLLKDEAASSNRAAESRSLYGPGSQQDSHQAAGRRTTWRWSSKAKGAIEADQATIKNIDLQLAVLQNHRPDLRHDRPAIGRPRKHGQSQRPDRHGRDQSAAADHGRVHDSARRHRPTCRSRSMQDANWASTRSIVISRPSSPAARSRRWTTRSMSRPAP